MNEERTDRDDQEREPRPRPGIWDTLVAEDQTELDLEQLAAFAEGRLPPEEHEEVRRLVARSPRAMELVDSLQEFLEEQVAQEPSKVIAQPAASKPRERSAQHWQTYALAASVLVAAFAGYMALAARRESRQIATQDLTERVGRWSRGEKDKSVTRGSQPEARIDELLERGESLGAAHVKAGLIALLPRDANPETALKACAAARASNLRTPELLNLEAALLFQRASAPNSATSQADFKAAEERLWEAAEIAPEDAPTWFNLVLVCRARGEAEEEAEAWAQFLQHEKRPDYRDAARKLLGK